MRLHHSLRASASAARRGMTLLEVAIAAVIVASIMVVSNAAFLSSFTATEQAQDLRSVGLLLDTVMEDVSAQPYANLLSLNGNQIFDGTTADDSRVRVTLETFQSEVDLVQVRAIATEIDTGREVGRVVSLRTQR